MAVSRHLGYTKNGHKFATVLPIDVMFASMGQVFGVGRSNIAAFDDLE